MPHIGLPDAPVELVAVPGLKTRDPGVALVELRLHRIGHMREADGRCVSRGKCRHGFRLLAGELWVARLLLQGIEDDQDRSRGRETANL
jgi:hypothetical protein